MGTALDLAFRTMLFPVDEHRHLLAASPGPDGRLVTLWVRSKDADALADTTFSDPVTATVIEYDRDVHAVVPVLELSLRFPVAQLFPDGRLLIVGQRCRWRPEPLGPEHNALLLDAEGNLIRTGVLGDGIEHLQVGSDGRIWVGYFDEGILGNYGWRGPGPDPIGAPGLICFDDTFEAVWKLADPRIIDCYALNVDCDVAWTSYHPDFPVVRITGSGHTKYWDNEIRGVCAMLVSGNRIALLSGYTDGVHHVAYGRLDRDRLHIEETGRLPMPDDGPLAPGDAVYARGDTLHVVRGSTWYTASLRSSGKRHGN